MKVVSLADRRGLHRYCSGCAHETEHVAWSRDGRGAIPSIRWPAAERAGGTTICLDCGQWRAGPVDGTSTRTAARF